MTFGFNNLSKSVWEWSVPIQALNIMFRQWSIYSRFVMGAILNGLYIWSIFLIVPNSFSIIFIYGDKYSSFGKRRITTGPKFVSKMFIYFWELISPPTSVNVPIPSLFTQLQNIAEYFSFQRTPRHSGRHTSSGLLICKIAYSDEWQPEFYR